VCSGYTVTTSVYFNSIRTAFAGIGVELLIHKCGLQQASDGLPAIHLQGCPSALKKEVVDPDLKTGGVMGPGLKMWGSWVPRIQQTEAHSTGLRVSSSDIFI